jgi:hypothetical protein
LNIDIEYWVLNITNIVMGYQSPMLQRIPQAFRISRHLSIEY